MRRNLHDGLGPALSSAMLKLGAARRLLPSGSPANDLTVEDVRGLVYDLRPPALTYASSEALIFCPPTAVGDVS